MHGFRHHIYIVEISQNLKYPPVFITTSFFVSNFSWRAFIFNLTPVVCRSVWRIFDEFTVLVPGKLTSHGVSHTIKNGRPLKATSAMVRLGRAPRRKATLYFFSRRRIYDRPKFIQTFRQCRPDNYCKQITGLINHIIFMLAKDPFTIASKTGRYISYHSPIHGTVRDRYVFSKSVFR